MRLGQGPWAGGQLAPHGDCGLLVTTSTKDTGTSSFCNPGELPAAAGARNARRPGPSGTWEGRGSEASGGGRGHPSVTPRRRHWSSLPERTHALCFREQPGKAHAPQRQGNSSCQAEMRE